MRLLPFAALLCLPLLTACQSLPFGDDAAPPSKPQSVKWEQQTPGCQGEKCSIINVDSLTFKDDAALSSLIEKTLLRMATANGSNINAATLREYADKWLKREPQDGQCWLQAKQIDQYNDMRVIELSSLLGRGEQVTPGREFINYSSRQQRAIRLEHVLLKGKADEFWSLVHEAHTAWLANTKLDQAPGFVAQWPFKPTRNIAFLKDHVLLKYEVHSIAPYTLGHPTLALPYRRLKGIFKPEFLPAELL